MMDENKLREAVERIAPNGTNVSYKDGEQPKEVVYGQHVVLPCDLVKCMRDLVEQFLALKDWPDRKSEKEEDWNYLQDYFKACGFNEAIDLCKLSSIKNRLSREEIEDTICRYMQDVIDPACVSGLADAVLKLMEKGGEV